MVNGLAVTFNNLLQRMPLLKQSLWYAPAKTHLLLWHHFPKTPLGALSVVVCAILSSLFLNEKLSFFGWLGCGLCIVRVNAWLFSSYYIHNAFHYSLGPLSSHLMVWEPSFLCRSLFVNKRYAGPQEASVGQIREFQKLFLSVGFLVYAGILIGSSLAIIFYFAPRWVSSWFPSISTNNIPQIWQDEHVILYFCLQYDRWHLSQCDDGPRCCNRGDCNGPKSGVLSFLVFYHFLIDVLV